MAIFRGTGGSGDSTTDTTVNTVTQKAAEAAASATAAASSATQAANSAASINANIVNDTTPQLGGELDGQTNKITNIGDPTSAQDAATKTYVDSQVQSKDALSELSGDSDDITEGSTNLFLTTTERTKLSGIEASATADQTAAEIRTLVESASDSNVFTDADHSKLNGIEASATADQTDAEIKTAYENNSDTNAFTDAEQTKLSGIETGATADQTASEILTAIKTVDGSGSGLDADLLDGNEASAFATSAQGSTADSALQNVSEDTTPQLGGDLDLNSNDITGTGNINITGTLQTSGNIISGQAMQTTQGILVGSNAIVGNTISAGGDILVSGTVDGRDVAADGTKLDGVASSATANPNAIDNVVEDTSPQLGGDLDLNSNDITGTGNINITGTLQTSSDAIIGGDLTVSGTTTTVNTETINLADNNIVLNSNLSSSTAPSENCGITVNRGSSTDKVFQWNESSDYWEADAILEIETDTGSVQIGSLNSSYMHFYTDRGRYYFNKELVVDEGIINSYNEDLQLGRAFSSTARMRLTDGTTHSDQAFDVTGNITVSGTVDGRDLVTDGTKLDGIEASADVTDATNVAAAGALMDSEVTNLAQVKAFDSSDYATAAQGTTADAALPKAGGTMTGNIVLGDNVTTQFGAGTDLVIKHNGTHSQINNNTGSLQLNQFANDQDVVINSDDGSGSTANYFRADGSTGDAILYHYGSEKIKTQSGGVDVTGNITVSGTVDGRDLATDGTKLDGIESNATADQTKADIDALNINADQVDGVEASQFLRSDADDSFTGTIKAVSDNQNPVLQVTGTGPNSIRFYDGTDTSVNTNSVDIIYRTNPNDLRIEKGLNENIIAEFGGDDGHAALYYDNSKKLETTSSGVDITGNITVSGTVDGRDLATDGTKLDGIEASADVTDTANVTSAGALMTSGGTVTSATTPLTATTSSSSGESAAHFKRSASNGSLVTFENSANVTVGVISTTSNDLLIGTGDTGLYFEDSTNEIEPFNPTNRTSTNGVISLGASNRKFKDLYLGGNITVDGTVDGKDVSTLIANVSEDSSPELGGNLDLSTHDIITSSNRDIELAANGTGRVVVKGNDNQGTIVLNCEANTHGQTIIAQPHSEGVTNTLTLPAGGDQEIVGASATQTLTNKTLTSAVLNTGISGTAIKDEDNMSSNSATHLATQQSIKAYVDAEVAGAGGGGVTVQDEGSALSTTATTLNFVGSGVAATGTGATKTITISGGGGGGVTVEDEGSALSTTATALNFVGAGVTASGTGATKTITIAGGSGSSGQTLIATGTVSDVSSIDFNSSVITGYEQYRIVLTNVVPSTDAQELRMSLGIANSSDTTTSKYAQMHRMYGRYAGANYGESGNGSFWFGTNGYFVLNNSNYGRMGTDTGETLSTEVYLSNPNSTSGYKLVNVRTTIYNGMSTYPMILSTNLNAFVFADQTAVNFATFYVGSGNIATATYRVYGIS